MAPAGRSGTPCGRMKSIRSRRSRDNRPPDSQRMLNGRERDFPSGHFGDNWRSIRNWYALTLPSALGADEAADEGTLSATELNDAYGDRTPVGRCERVLEAALPMEVNQS